MTSPGEPPETVPLATIVREWGRIGCIGFGGPPAHIRLLRDLCVQRRQWLDAEDFEDAVAACNLLPGPASTQLAIFCAWRLRGRLGALAVAVTEDAKRLGARLRLANNETKALDSMGHRWWRLAGMDEATARRRLYRLGADRYRDRLLMAWARSGEASDSSAWRQLATLPERWHAPKFPLKAADFIARGIADQIDTEDRDRQQKARPEDQRRLDLEVGAAFRHHVAPGRRLRADAGAEERQDRFGEDRRSTDIGALHDQRRNRVRHQMPPHDLRQA